MKRQAQAQLALSTSEGTPLPLPTHVVEDAVAEGNVLELPLFRLSQHPGKAPADPQTALNRLIHVYRLDGRTDQDAQLKNERRIEITANQRWGFPTMLGLRILVAVMERSQQMGFSSPKIPISRWELCDLLNLDKCGKSYTLLNHQIAAMKALTIICHNCWHRKGAPKASSDKQQSISLIADFAFEQEGGAQPSSQTQLAFGTPQHITLGDAIYQSLSAGYRLGIDRSYLNDLARFDNAAAVRLYAYLSKKDTREMYTENIIKLASKLPHSDLRPTKIKKTLEPALRRLTDPLPHSGKRFLESFVFEGTGSDTRLVVRYFSPDGAPRRLKAL
ncbi:hypothetical protein NVS55_40100 (plasmid) [Myxococcus stipitatus]|uniref:hypothetical protein n=1 Tax=Myxococcus stipitatus TaxID=83455 RepID=UPI0031455246